MVVVVVVVVEGDGIVVLLVVVGGAVVAVVVDVGFASQETNPSGTSARIGTRSLSTPSNLTTRVSSPGSLSTTSVTPLCAAFPVANVRARLACSERSRATPSA